MILIRGLRLNPVEDHEALLQKAAKKLRIDLRQIKSLTLQKKSLDARRKSDLHYSCTVLVSLAMNEDKLLAKRKSNDICAWQEVKYDIQPVGHARSPIIVGFGPAGMFAALVLAKAGAKPIVIERGQDALSRQAAIAAFRAGGELDPECNVQFGEGGAGTFSDGKLNTGTKDRRQAWMLRQFVEHGAPENILYDAKPHIGTDILITVVQNIRKSLIALGGEVRFGTKLEQLHVENGRLRAVEVSDSSGHHRLDCDALILAIGHSARDTYEGLLAQGLAMEQKAFSMGVRIEHKQSDIDLAQYGREKDSLPAADYSLNVHLSDSESAYTFCMCPGGEVIAAASEHGGLVTNGMSYNARNGENANSALLVTLRPEDFPSREVLSGMYWQREIEQAAFAYGGGNYLAPAQLVGDFLSCKASRGEGSVKPSYKPGVIWGDLREVLPERICAVLEKALPELDKKLVGFANTDAVLTAPETRSSAPVRIIRDARLNSNIAGVYPCGEGAGYAGGISSAAVDGMRCAEALIESLNSTVFEPCAVIDQSP